MTDHLRARFDRALAILCWSGSALGRAAGVREGSGQRWVNGRHVVPVGIVEWMERLARFHEANPAPRAPPVEVWSSEERERYQNDERETER
jgi:hypothetical protein